MSKWLILPLIALIAWFGLKDMIYTSLMSRGPAIMPPALDYAEKTDWFAYPEELPGGAWETPWGIDAFLVLPPPRDPHRHGLVLVGDASPTARNSETFSSLREAIPAETPLYTPAYRAPSPANHGDTAARTQRLAGEDLLAAFETYLETANQGRGIILIVAEPSSAYAEAILERLQSDELANRFAGLVSFNANGGVPAPLELKCAVVLNSACHQQVETSTPLDIAGLFLPRLKNTGPATSIIDAPGVANAIRVQAEQVSAWLDETEPKPAEPFFAVEVITDVPIYRPGADAPVDAPED